MCLHMILSQTVCIYLVHLLSRASAEVLQREVSNDVTIVPTAHVHNQEPVVFKCIDLMQREHGCCTVLHVTHLAQQSQQPVREIFTK